MQYKPQAANPGQIMMPYGSGNLQKYKNPVSGRLWANFLNHLSLLVNSLNAAGILEVGCGEGFVARHLISKNKGLSITGIDTSTGAVAMAQAVCPEAVFEKKDLYSLSPDDGLFDLVLAVEVLEHLADPRAAIQKIKQLAGRYCIFTVPLEPYFTLGNLMRGRHILRLGNPQGHIWHWDRRSFNNLLFGYFNSVEIKIIFPWMLALCKRGGDRHG